jgi:shikimate dehydrogenase
LKKLALLGFPVAYSVSPDIHNAAFEEAGLDWRYEAMEVAPDELMAALASMRLEDWRGANLTIPHKEAALPLLDEIDPSAGQTLAVNTVVNKRGHLVGYNTDLHGFMRDLGAHWQVPTTGRALILGAGGGARAVAFGLAQEGLDLTLIARSTRRAERLAEDVRESYKVEVAAHPWVRQSFVEAAHRCVLVVNTTPLGMRPNTQDSPWPSGVPLPPAAFVYDLIYTPRDTRLVRMAHQSGVRAVSGSGMLLEQAALSFELWTGQRAPRERMRTALGAALDSSERRENQPDLREVPDA